MKCVYRGDCMARGIPWVDWCPACWAELDVALRAPIVRINVEIARAIVEDGEHPCPID